MDRFSVVIGACRIASVVVAVAAGGLAVAEFAPSWRVADRPGTEAGLQAAIETGPGEAGPGSFAAAAAEGLSPEQGAATETWPIAVAREGAPPELATLDPRAGDPRVGDPQGAPAAQSAAPGSAVAMWDDLSDLPTQEQGPPIAVERLGAPAPLGDSEEPGYGGAESVASVPAPAEPVASAPVPPARRASAARIRRTAVATRSSSWLPAWLHWPAHGRWAGIVTEGLGGYGGAQGLGTGAGGTAGASGSAAADGGGRGGEGGGHGGNGGGHR